MANSPLEWLVGDLSEKKRWKAYKARVAAMPTPYRDSVDAIARYLTYLAASDGDNWIQAFDDLTDLFERAAADQTPIRDIVGGNQVDFAETFASNYGEAGWISKEQRRLTEAIHGAEALQGSR